jgi:hypothetical protein
LANLESALEEKKCLDTVIAVVKAVEIDQLTAGSSLPPAMKSAACFTVLSLDKEHVIQN